MTDGIPLDINAVGQHHESVIILVLFINPEHLFFDLGADRRAGGEEKVCDVDLACEALIGDPLTVLVDEPERRDRVIYRIAIDNFHPPDIREPLITMGTC